MVALILGNPHRHHRTTGGCTTGSKSGSSPNPIREGSRRGTVLGQHDAVESRRHELPRTRTMVVADHRDGLPAGDTTPRLLVFGVMPETVGSTAEGLGIARRVGTVHAPFLHREGGFPPKRWFGRSFPSRDPSLVHAPSSTPVARWASVFFRRKSRIRQVPQSPRPRCLRSARPQSRQQGGLLPTPHSPVLVRWPGALQ